MKTMNKCFLVAMMVLAGLCLSAPRVSAAAATEDKLIADLSSSKEGTVTSALAKLETELKVKDKVAINASPAIPAIKKLLTDPRKPVMRKAARVLGTISADVSEADVKNIAVLLSSKEKPELEDGLKSLRGFGAQAKSAVPQIVPLLQNADNNVKRDACRTLAVLGDKSVVPNIEPLLKDPDAKVEADAADAINILKLK